MVSPIILVTLGIVLVGFVGYSLLSSAKAPVAQSVPLFSFTATPPPVASTPITLPKASSSSTVASTPSVAKTSSEQATFTGTVTSYSDECMYDGTCSITVGSKVVIVDAGGDPIRPSVVGKLIGIPRPPTKDIVGKRVIVYASQLPSGEFTIYGDRAYYVKILP